MLQCIFKSVSLPKCGNATDENEDKILEPGKAEPETEAVIRFAIADGATEASFSKEWAELLVNAYKDKSFDKEQLSETLNAISEIWQSITNITELPWYAQQKAEKGAFATFLGVTIDREKGLFDVAAVGDCALFQIRDSQIIFSFPVSSFEDFNNTPDLIASNKKYQTNLDKIAVYDSGTIQQNDIILLATDAMAAWILKQKDRHKRIRKSLIGRLEKQDETSFDEWLNKQRKAKRIKNDDVTLLMIKFE